LSDWSVSPPSDGAPPWSCPH